jgi:mono/diheme cytochrome c family protein
MRFVLLLTATVSLWMSPISAQTSNQSEKATQTSSQVPAGSVERGKKLWVDRACYQCHGYVAQGGLGTGSGPRLANSVPPWDYFLKYIRRPAEQMIPYTAKVLPDQEAADIYAWLKSLPAPPPVSSIPELK